MRLRFPLVLVVLLACVAVPSAFADDTTNPTVAFTSPVAGATLSQTQDLTATASDDSGTISSVAFYRNQASPYGTFLGNGTDDGAGHYVLSVDVGGWHNQPWTIYAEASDPSGNVGTDSRSFVVANSAAVVTSVDVPPARTYKEGDTLAFTAHYDRQVVARGITAVRFEIGGSTFYAEDADGPASTEVHFTFPVPSNREDRDGISVTGLVGLIEDLGANAADNTLHGVGSTANVLVDSAAPAVTSVGVPAGRYHVGDQIHLFVHFNENVVVNTSGGRPALGLTVGTHARSAGYLAGSGGSTLLFSYTVQAGDKDANGIRFGALTLNGGTIKDTVGHAANLDLASLVHSPVGVFVGKPTTTAPPAATPTPAPAAKDTTPPTKPASPAVKVTGGQLQVSFGRSTDNDKVAGYRLYRAGTAIATIDGTSIKLPLGMIGKPGTMVLELRAFDAAGNQSDPVTLTLIRSAAPKTPKVMPAWAWKLARWQQAPTAQRGIRPHTPATLPNWYGKWNSWHKAPVTVTVA